MRHRAFLAILIALPAAAQDRASLDVNAPEAEEWVQAQLDRCYETLGQEDPWVADWKIKFKVKGQKGRKGMLVTFPIHAGSPLTDTTWAVRGCLREAIDGASWTGKGKFKANLRAAGAPPLPSGPPPQGDSLLDRTPEQSQSEPASASSSGDSGSYCCVNGAYYDCPSSSAMMTCTGDFMACTASCDMMDMDCMAECEQKYPIDPSFCTRNPDKDPSCD